ncbi:MAG TPA: nucleotide exchange factor GrpE, partial [Firmicutes bacterium]|nr:nucleotide exchange factor GrpE [Bacillota bacterium]
VFTEVRSDYPPGTVVEELQKGYMFNERVLRASMVKVSAE